MTLEAPAQLPGPGVVTAVNIMGLSVLRTEKTITMDSENVTAALRRWARHDTSHRLSGCEPRQTAPRHRLRGEPAGALDRAGPRRARLWCAPSSAPGGKTSAPPPIGGGEKGGRPLSPRHLTHSSVDGNIPARAVEPARTRSSRERHDGNRCPSIASFSLALFPPPPPHPTPTPPSLTPSLARSLPPSLAPSLPPSLAPLLCPSLPLSLTPALASSLPRFLAPSASLS